MLREASADNAWQEARVEIEFNDEIEFKGSPGAGVANGCHANFGSTPNRGK